MLLSCLLNQHQILNSYIDFCIKSDVWTLYTLMIIRKVHTKTITKFGNKILKIAFINFMCQKNKQ